jgi:hypothetical protein
MGRVRAVSGDWISGCSGKLKPLEFDLRVIARSTLTRFVASLAGRMEYDKIDAQTIQCQAQADQDR